MIEKYLNRATDATGQLIVDTRTLSNDGTSYSVVVTGADPRHTAFVLGHFITNCQSMQGCIPRWNMEFPIDLTNGSRSMSVMAVSIRR